MKNIKNIKELAPEELAGILKNNLDYVLELGILEEPKLSIKPVFKFERAFAAECEVKSEIECETQEKVPEFCLIYSEADDPEAVYVSLNSNKFENILSGYTICKTIFHGGNANNIIEGELCESFYHDGRDGHDGKDSDGVKNLKFRLLIHEDKELAEANAEDEYLNIIFEDFIEKKIWSDCGIIGAFDEFYNFTGYLAYYGIAENIRDVSYIYVKKEYRRTGRAKEILKYFINKNIQENKISYYSYAADKISEKLAKSCGFLPCAKKYEKDETDET